MAGEESAHLNPLETLVKQSQDSAKSYQETADKLRSRAGAWGSAVQVLGLAAVAWIGFDDLVDVFPTYGWGWLLAVLIIFSIGLMASSAIYLGRNLSKQNRPLAMSSNIQDMVDSDEIDKKEVKRVRGIYHQFAKLNNLDVDDKPEPDPLTDDPADLAIIKANKMVSDAMAAYFAKAVLYESNVEKAYSDDPVTNTVSVPTDDEVLRKLNFGLTRAAQIRADLQATRAKACVVVIRDRVMSATVGRGPCVAISIFAVSLISVWFLSDGIKAYNAIDANKIATAKLCGEALQALADGKADFPLPEDCKAVAGSGDVRTESNASDIALANLVALSLDFVTCQASVKVEDDEVATNAKLQACKSISAASDATTRIDNTPGLVVRI